MSAQKNDYYETLGVSKTASPEEIKSAYRKQAVKWHPDKHQGSDKEEAEKRFKQVNEAYQILSDADKRKSYDQFGHAAFSPGGGGFSGGNPFSGFGGQNPFTYTYTTNSSNSGNPNFGDPFDIFEQFFGGGSPFRAQSLPRYSIGIDFDEAFTGIEREVSIEGKKRKIKIPAGVADGSRIQFNDFILSIHVKPSKIFDRDGADVYVNLSIPYSTAVAGGDVSVPTLDGETVKIKVRSGTQIGSYIRLREQGFPRLQGRGRGDLYVKVLVNVPKKLSRTQKDLLSRLKREGL